MKASQLLARLQEQKKHVKDLEPGDVFNHREYGVLTLEDDPEPFRSKVDGPGYVLNVIDKDGRSQIFVPDSEAMVTIAENVGMGSKANKILEAFLAVQAIDDDSGYFIEYDFRDDLGLDSNKEMEQTLRANGVDLKGVTIVVDNDRTVLSAVDQKRVRDLARDIVDKLGLNESLSPQSVKDTLRGLHARLQLAKKQDDQKQAEEIWFQALDMVHSGSATETQVYDALNRGRF